MDSERAANKYKQVEYMKDSLAMSLKALSAVWHHLDFG